MRMGHTEEEEIYIERTESHDIKMKDIVKNIEYHICDRNEGGRIIINGDAFFVIKRIDKIEVCVVEDILPKYWEHEYISAKLWFESYEEAVESDKRFYSVFKDVDPCQLYSMLYMFKLPLNFEKLSDVIEEVDNIINSVKQEAKAIARRKLLKYFN